MYAAYKGDQSKLSKTQQNYIKRIRVAEVTQKYLGMIEKRDGKDVVVILINKNEKIPCSVTRSYFTEYDNQRTFAISITEASDSTDDPRFVNVKAIQELPLPANRPAGQEIEITYSFDDSQIVHVSYVVVGVGSAVSVTTSIEGDSNNIDKFTVDDGLCSTKIPSKIDKFLVD